MHDDVDRLWRKGWQAAGEGGKADGLYFKFKSIRQWTLLVLLTHSTKERGKKKETRRSVRLSAERSEVKRREEKRRGEERNGWRKRGEIQGREEESGVAGVL